MGASRWPGGGVQHRRGVSSAACSEPACSMQWRQQHAARPTHAATLCRSMTTTMHSHLAAQLLLLLLGDASKGRCSTAC